MIELNRSKQNKWILQKNISSSDLVETFVEAMKKQNDIINHDYMKQQLQNEKLIKVITDNVVEK